MAEIDAALISLLNDPANEELLGVAREWAREKGIKLTGSFMDLTAVHFEDLLVRLTRSHEGAAGVRREGSEAELSEEKEEETDVLK